VDAHEPRKKARNLTQGARGGILVLVGERTGLGVAVALCVAVGGAGPACSSKEPTHPAELGNCSPTFDASCVNAGSSGGVVGPQADAAENEDGAPVTDAGGSCGVASTYIVTQTRACAPCIANNCCLADQVCSIAPSSATGCVYLLMCMLGCSGDQLCMTGCEAASVAVTPYTDFAKCIATNCPTQCPAPPLTTPSDL
jgi:hypothetical protein